MCCLQFFFFFFQAEDGIRDHCVTGVQTCALPIYSAHTALLELVVADGEHLVDDQHFRIEMCGDSEGKAHVHTCRVALDRRVHELLDTAELDDLRELPRYLATAHTQNRAVEVDVLAAGQLGMETRA